MIASTGLPPITRDGARAAAERELSKGIYHRYDDPLPVRVFRAVVRWIEHVLSAVGRHSPGGGAGATALLIAVVALVAVARWRLGGMQRRAGIGSAVLEEHLTTAAAHRRLAEQAAEEGRWADAVLARMRALARSVEERGDLPAAPGRTAEELATALARLRPEIAKGVRSAATVFDEVAYGERPTGPAAYETVVAADVAVNAATATSRRAAGVPV